MTDLKIREEYGNTDRRLNILFIAGCWYPHQENPVQGPFVRRHAEAVALNHDVTVLHPIALPDGPLSPECQWEHRGRVREIHIRFRGLPSLEGGTLASQWAYFRSGLYGCRELRKRGLSPDILHFHIVPSFGLMAAVRAVFPKRPIVLTEHWTGYVPESGVVLSRARRLYTGSLSRAAASVTVVSNYHKRMMRALGFDGSYIVIPNVVDMALFRPPGGSRKGSFRFVHVSGFRSVKRVPDIVRAAANIIHQGRDLELHLVGAGPDAEAARAIALDSGVLGSRVVFHGELNDEGVAEKVRDSDCSVLFSDFENSPCVVGEALACGKPMLASRIAGIPEHITLERGVLVAQGNLGEFTAAMGELVCRGRTWNSNALRTYAENTFSQSTISALFDRVYKNALGSDPATAVE